MRLVVTFILFITLYTSANCQQSFSEFISLFKTYKWKDLPEAISTLPLGRKLDIDKANQFMWNEHAKGVRVPVTNYTWEVSGPHVKSEDGTFERAEFGIFYKESFRPKGESNSLYAVAKVNLNAEIIILITYYDVFDSESGYRKHYNAYTYRLKDEKLISAVELSEAIIFDDFKVNCIETYYKGEEEELFRVSYKLGQGGYFIKTKKNSVPELIGNNVLLRSVVTDSKGSVNIRAQPNIASQVIFAIKSGEIILIEETSDPKWYGVIIFNVSGLTPETLPEAYKDRQFYSISGGYIHKSRIREYKE